MEYTFVAHQDNEGVSDDGYISGWVDAIDKDGKVVDSCGWDYNLEREETDLHKYSKPGWLSGSCYEIPLPEIFTENYEDCMYAVDCAIDEYLEQNQAVSAERE